MESHISKKADDSRRQAELRNQIALLQSQLVDVPELDQPSLRSSPKRKDPGQSILAPATPSPKKKRKLSHQEPLRNATRSNVSSLCHSENSTKNAHKQHTSSSITRPMSISLPSTKTPSTFITKLASLSSRHVDTDPMQDRITRSTGFEEKPATARYNPPPDASKADDVFGGMGEDKGVERDGRLAIIERLIPGPYTYTPPFDDPNFEQYEPHSTIRLSSRNIPHEEFQDYLRSRYLLSPSKLYSVIRLLPNKQGYDVPVEGDWVTIAVVAERGPIKFTRAPVSLGNEEDERIGLKGKQPAKSNNKDKPSDAQPKPHGKKYVNLKLIDFGCRTSSSSSHTGGQATIRGDAFLSLLLFESDGFDTVTGDGASKGKKVYKGGSKGAFESMAKLKEGAVIALLNPKVLKPFQRSHDSPHPTDNILALTPESASSIVVIGHAKDLGMCAVLKQNGKVCGQWVDRRTSDVCEWHVQNAVERRRASRAEFSSGTSGMAMSATKKNSAYDPARQWGLKPDETGGVGATYVVSGHVVSGSVSDSRSMYIGETIGREAQAKASRVSAKDADKALKALLDKDKDGMRAVVKAREAISKSKDPTEKKTARAKAKTGDDLDAGSSLRPLHKNAFSADIVKKLGFDPTGRAGGRDGNDVKKKLDSLAIAHSSKQVELGPRPGRLRSCVSAPVDQEINQSAPFSLKAGLLSQSDEGMIDLDSSDVE